MPVMRELLFETGFSLFTSFRCYLFLPALRRLIFPHPDKAYHNSYSGYTLNNVLVVSCFVGCVPIFKKYPPAFSNFHGFRSFPPIGKHGVKIFTSLKGKCAGNSASMAKSRTGKPECYITNGF